MWIITNLNTGQCFHLIPEKSKYVVGRTGAEIALKDDTSISRTHALLQFRKLPQDSITLIDSGSKYGSFHNNGITTNNKIIAGQTVELHDGDRIRFGLLKNEWKLTHVPLKSMCSSLPVNKAEEFEEHLSKLGGVLINKWEPGCTHLTMSEIAVTVKVLYALLNNVPIVSCEYWKDMLQAASSGQTVLPKPDLYMPKKSELLMNKSDLDFGFQLDRTKLFSGKTFIFMNKKHYDMYGPIVNKAGGACRNLNNGVQKALLIMHNVVVVQYVPSTQSQSTQTINNISEFLESNSRRIIPEYEIGLAIVHCSIEKYCNPAYKILSDLLPSTHSMAIETYEAELVENTSGPNSDSNTESDLEVPETDCTALSVPTADIIDKTANICDKVIEHSDSQIEDDMPNIVVTQNTNEESQNKRKRSSNINVNYLDDDDDDDDDDFFPAVKKPNQNRESVEALQDEISKEKDPPHISKNNVKLKNSSNVIRKPLPIVINEKKNKISTAGFLNKTQTHSTQKECEVSSSQKHSEEAPKRGRIALITDDDSGDDNDLFNFGSSRKTPSAAKKPRIADVRSSNFEDSDDEMFAFTKPSDDNESEDLAPTQEFTVKENPKKTASLPIIQPKLIPQKVNTAGWLCSSFNKINLKQLKADHTLEHADVSTKCESNNTQEKRKVNPDDEEKKYPGLFSGFEVRFNVFPKRYKEKNQDSNESTSKISHQKSSTNFKVFVKETIPNSAAPKYLEILCILLKIKPQHLQTDCRLSAANLCKGKVLKLFITERNLRQGVKYAQIIYAGDGNNDVCRVLSLLSGGITRCKNVGPVLGIANYNEISCTQATCC